MADFGSPVAQNVNVNPQQGIQTLSGLLSLKRQQVGLEQQQQELETQTAQAYQASQSATERQALAKIDWKPFFANEDIAGAQKVAMAVAPTTGAEFSSRLADAMQNGLAVKSAAVKLNQQYLEPYRNALALWGNDPDADIADLAHQLDAVREGVPKSARPDVDAMVNGTLTSLAHPDLLSGTPKTLAQQKQAALTFGRVGLPGPEVSGTSGFTAPITGTAVGKSGAMVGTAQSRTTAAVQQAPGAVGLGLAPTQTVPYQASVAGATAAAGARATGVASIDTQRASQVSSSIQPSMAAIGLTQQIDSLADQIHSGKFADEISKAAASLGLQNETYARQLLKKDLGQVQARAITNAPTDESRGTILSGYPEATSDPQTIHTAMDYIRGSFRQNLARGRLLNNYQQSKPDLTGFQHADDALTGTMDPLMTEYQALKTPQERIGFYKRNFQTAEEAHAFKNKVQGVGHILGANATGP